MARATQAASAPCGMAHGGMSVADDHRPCAHGDIIATLFDRCRHDPDAAWPALGEAMLRMCAADGAGVVVPRSHRPPACVGDAATLPEEACAALGAALAGEPRIVHWQSAHDGRSYAAVAIAGGDPASDGFVWARRAGAFAWWQVLPLRWGGRFAGMVTALRDQAEQAELALLESRHRCANDLQLINSLLTFEARQSAPGDTRETLAKLSDRVLSLAVARQASGLGLAEMLRYLVAGLSAQIECRGIAIAVDAAFDDGLRLSEQRRGLLMIAVNECVTNAVKHGFDGGRRGTIAVRLHADGARLVVDVSDDGRPLPAGCVPRFGSGLDLVSRMLAGARGRLNLPPPDSKTFRIELPIG